MKRSNFIFAILTLSAVFLIEGCDRKRPTMDIEMTDENSMLEQMTGDMRTFYDSLSDDAQDMFLKLDPAHRRRAMDTCNKPCSGRTCKNMNRPDDCVNNEYQKQMAGE